MIDRIFSNIQRIVSSFYLVVDRIFGFGFGFGRIQWIRWDSDSAESIKDSDWIRILNRYLKKYLIQSKKKYKTPYCNKYSLFFSLTDFQSWKLYFYWKFIINWFCKPNTLSYFVKNSYQDSDSDSGSDSVIFWIRIRIRPNPKIMDSVDHYFILK